MVTPRRTITRDSVLRPAAPRPAAEAQAMPQPPAPPSVQAPPEPAEPANRQTAVWLGDQEVEWLDDQCRVIRRGGWRGVTRSALIRAVIRATIARDPDLGGVADEAGLADRLAAP